MIRISKTEKEYLLSKGYKWSDHIHKTHSNSGITYYATEDKRLLKELKNYRQSRIISSYGNYTDKKKKNN